MSTSRPGLSDAVDRQGGGAHMPIGKLVKTHIGEILTHCDTVDHDEILALLDKGYSKETFGTNFPFCAEVDVIEPAESKRYWTEVYVVRGKRVRVTSQWFDQSEPQFKAYLAAKGIKRTDSADVAASSDTRNQTSRVTTRTNARYRGNAIGNAQNAFIRNVLSNLGRESFSERDWGATKEWFSNRCAYCGAQTDLLIEHAMPINRESLGEHRLGNLVPSCHACNADKGSKDFRSFLGDNVEAIAKIEEYMDSRNYVPLEANEQISLVLNMAHKEVAALADRYVTILNQVFGQDASIGPEEDRGSGSASAPE